MPHPHRYHRFARAGNRVPLLFVKCHDRPETGKMHQQHDQLLRDRVIAIMGARAGEEEKEEERGRFWRPIP